METPTKCRECKFIGDYTRGPFIRYPHYCCELIWNIKRVDRHVDPETLDEKCPLKNKKLIEAFNEIDNDDH